MPLELNFVDYFCDLIHKEEEYYSEFVRAFRRYNVVDELIEQYIADRAQLIKTLKSIAEFLAE